MINLKKFQEWFAGSATPKQAATTSEPSGPEESTEEDIQLVHVLQTELVGQLNALHNAAIVSETDLKGDIIFANDLFCQISGYSRAEVMGRNHRFLKSGHQPDSIFADLWRTISSGQYWSGKVKNRKKDGGYYWVIATITPALDAAGKPYKYISVRFDITAQIELEENMQQTMEELVQHEEELQQSLEELSATNEELLLTQLELRGRVQATDNAALVSETDLQGNITYANDTFCRTAKYTREELMGQNHRILKSGLQPDELFADMWTTIAAGKYFQGEVLNKAKDGTFYWVIATITPILGADGKPYKYVSIRFDITRQKEQEETVRRLNAQLEAGKQLLEHRVEEQEGALIDSITYARRIQFSVMPTLEAFKAAVPPPYEAGVLFLPRDQVSGDFYWCGAWKNKTVLALGDGTGHGVPGAFLSIVGISALAKLVEERGVFEPASLLDELDDEVRKLLKQHIDGVADDVIQDSIEMNVLCLTPHNDAVLLASAMRKTLLVRQGALEELPADRRPVGGTLYGNEPFNTQKFNLAPGDTLYLFSDGFMSQFGGPEGVQPRKFGPKAFRELVLEVARLDHVEEQVAAFRQAFDAWKGPDAEQTDDVIVAVLKHRGG